MGVKFYFDLTNKYFQALPDTQHITKDVNSNLKSHFLEYKSIFLYKYVRRLKFTYRFLVRFFVWEQET